MKEANPEETSSKTLCLQDRVKTLEMELDEEKSSAELLNDRINRSRDQVWRRNI